MALAKCAPLDDTRRRIFWTTQPNACGEYEDCGESCGIPGLQFTNDIPCGTDSFCSCTCTPASENPNCIAEYHRNRKQTGRSFATNDWVRSLLLNILNTDGRIPATECGVPPGTQGGHWSESYREDGLKIGTLLRSALKATKVTRIQDVVNLVRAQVQTDAYKLVQLGVAQKVDVEATYLGSNKISVVVSIFGPTNLTNVVNLVADRMTNGWVWQ